MFDVLNIIHVSCYVLGLALIGTVSWINFVFPSLRDELT